MHVKYSVNSQANFYLVATVSCFNSVRVSVSCVLCYGPTRPSISETMVKIVVRDICTAGGGH